MLPGAHPGKERIMRSPNRYYIEILSEREVHTRTVGPVSNISTARAIAKCAHANWPTPDVHIEKQMIFGRKIVEAVHANGSIVKVDGESSCS